MNPLETLSRRDLLSGLLLAAASGSVMTQSAQSDRSVLDRRQPRALKLSCSSLAFSDLKWDEALQEMRRLGFRFADLAMFEGWTHLNPSALNDPEDHAKKIATTCERLGIEPIAIHANFVLGDPKQFPGLTVGDAAARKTILAHFERVVSCARAAEIPLINVMPGRFLPDAPAELSLKNAVDMLTQMHARATQRGLLLSFENHTGSIGQEPADALYLLEKVPGLRLDYDISHVVCNQHSLEQTIPLLKYVAHIGARNAEPHNFSLPIRDGKLAYDLRPFLQAFRENRVSAYVSVEYFRPEDRDNIAILKEILEREQIPAT